MAYLKVVLTELIQPELPPLLSDVEELWHCDFCPVRSICEQTHHSPVGKATLES